jgi:hypothetical protein
LLRVSAFSQAREQAFDAVPRIAEHVLDTALAPSGEQILARRIS